MKPQTPALWVCWVSKLSRVRRPDRSRPGHSGSHPRKMRGEAVKIESVTFVTANDGELIEGKGIAPTEILPSGVSKSINCPAAT